MLGGFAKVAVPPGPKGAVSVTVSVPLASMAYWDPLQQAMVLEGGTYTMSVCQNSAACGSAMTSSVKVPKTIVGPSVLGGVAPPVTMPMAFA